MVENSVPTGPDALAGRRRFWRTVLVFAVVNIAVWVACYRLYAPRLSLLRVESFWPGDGITVGQRPTLRWTFNLDVAPQGHQQQSPASIMPNVPGRWWWEDAHTLAFAPDRELAKATTYTVTLLPDRLRTAQGISLARPYVCQVKTDPLHVVAVRQRGFDEHDRFVVEIQFDDKVIATDVLAKLKLTGANHHGLHFVQYGAAEGKIVRVLTDPVPREPGKDRGALHVHLDAGLAGVSGPLGLEHAFDGSLQLDNELRATGVTAWAPLREKPTIALQFNGVVNCQLVKPLLSVEPAAPFSVSGEGSELDLRGDFVPGRRYAVKIASAPKAMAGQAPRAGIMSVFIPDRAAGVWFEHREGYLGIRGNRTLLAHAVNVSELTVKAWRMYASNLVAWRNAGDLAVPESYSKPVATEQIKIQGAQNHQTDVRINLDDLLPQRVDGVYQITIERADRDPTLSPSQPWLDEEDYDAQNTDSALVTLSDIGLTAKRSKHAMLVWALSLSKATPIAHLRVRVFSNKNQLLGSGTTDRDGLARIEHIEAAQGEKPAVIVADRQGGTPAAKPVGEPATQPATPLKSGSNPAAALSWLDLRHTQWDLASFDVGGRAYLREGYEAFIYTDRGVYRPGETVHLCAIVRGAGGAVPGVFPVEWQIRRPDLHLWKSEMAMLDRDGACGLDLRLPKDLTTGQWTVELGLPGGKSLSNVFGRASFGVEEFVPTHLQVSVSLEQQHRVATARLLSDQAVVAQVRGEYFFGRPADGLKTVLSARLERSRFAPRQWNGWCFGDTAKVLDVIADSKKRPVITADRQLMLDSRGRGKWTLDLPRLICTQDSDSLRFRGPWKLSLAAEVRDLGGRAVAAGASASVDALPCYIGVRPRAGGPIPPGLPATFQVQLVRPDGQPGIGNPTLEAKLYLESWNNTLVFRNGRFRYDAHRVLDPASQAVAPSVVLDQGRGSIVVRAPGSGCYVLCLRDRTTGAMTSREFYVSDGSPWADTVSRENPERLDLVLLPASSQTTQPATMPAESLDQLPRTFKVGQQARVLVRSPFAGRLLLTLETDRVLQTRVLDMPASQVTVPIEIPAAAAPNAYVTATVVRPIRPNLKWRTHRAYGVARLCVDPWQRRLNVQVITDPQIRPGGELRAHVLIRDSRGHAVKDAAVTLAVVDEGVLQLTDFATPDPLGFFTADRALGVTSADLYSLLMPEVPRPDQTSSSGGDKDVGVSRYRSPVVAQRIKPVSLFSGVLHTDKNGVASASWQVPPGFLGKLRVMCVAYAGARLGSGQAGVLVRGPLIVQSSFPRFAAPGDRFSAPVEVMNNTKQAGAVTLNVEVSGPLLAVKTDSIHLVIPAGARQTVSLPVTVGRSVGVATVRLTATMGAERYEQNVQLPVRPPSPTVTRGGYAVVTPAKPVTLALSDDLMPGTQHVQVHVTPWPALRLPQGLEYLDQYPYGCAEQTISTAFPLIALKDLGPQIAPEQFNPQHIRDKVQAGITRLIGMQTADGGVAMWPGERNSWPWASVYAAHFIIEAAAAGNQVPRDFRDSLLSYVRHILDESSDDMQIIQTQAYACYVLALEGHPAYAAMNRLNDVCSRKPQLGEARMFLAMAYLVSGRSDLAGPLVRRKLIPRQGRESAGTLSSPTRDRAIYLEALLMARPKDPDLPMLAQQLADEGRRGQWRSTQDVAFAVMALGKYLRTIKPSAPYEAVQLLGTAGQLAASEGGKSLAWKCATTEPSGGRLTVTITGKASSRGYVSWIEQGVPLVPPDHTDHGMKVRRRYLDLQGHALATNTLRSGDLVRVQLTIEAPPWQKNLVIEDLLPAGLEVENARLKTSSQSAAIANASTLDHPHVDVRDDRIIVSGAVDQRGRAQFVYLARAVTPGVYIVPPVRAECMYDRGMNSISGGGQLTVKAPDETKLAHVQ